MTTTVDNSYARATKTSLKLNEETPYEAWMEIGKSLNTAQRAIQFWIGDWILFGEKKYGEKYKEAMEITGLSYGALRDITSVCANVPVSSRNDNLPYSHHKAVAKLSPKEQEKFLSMAEEEHMPVSKLRNLISGKLPEKKLTTCPHCGHQF